MQRLHVELLNKTKNSRVWRQKHYLIKTWLSAFWSIKFLFKCVCSRSKLISDRDRHLEDRSKVKTQRRHLFEPVATSVQAKLQKGILLCLIMHESASRAKYISEANKLRLETFVHKSFSC